MAKISIITPVYNVEAYLKKCIESVLSQEYTDFELLLIDDGSTDRSGLICEEYRSKDSRIKVIHKENGGVASARNLGITYAQGKYMTFLDSDDYYDCDWLSDLYNGITENHASICVGNYKAVSNDSVLLSKTQHELGVYSIPDKDSRIEHILTVVLSLKHGWEACTRLFDAALIKNNQILFCESCNNYAEDMGFVLASLLYADKIACINADGYNYRKHEGSMIARSRNDYRFNELNEVSRFFEKYYVDMYGEDKTVLPVTHFLIMYSEYRKIVASPEYPYMKKYIDQIADKEYWKSRTRAIFKCGKTILKYTNKFQMRRMMLLSHYCLHGDWKRFRIESGLFYRLFK